jgi:hypothetical protein
VQRERRDAHLFVGFVVAIRSRKTFVVFVAKTLRVRREELAPHAGGGVVPAPHRGPERG